jgi:outer membrane protein assembly factor BamD (BamD/ComL family)
VSAATPAAESATERETMLREENQQMSDARAAMRRGDAPRALVLLEQVRARFPGGMLVQEREALAIEALARSGRRGDASARAAAFLRAYPTSMFAERVQAFAR